MPLEISWLKQLADFAAATGPFGVIAVLIYFVWWLLGKMQERDATISQLQEKRAAEAQENTRIVAAALTSSTVHVSTSTLAMQELGRLQQGSIDLQRDQTGAIESLGTGLNRCETELRDLRNAIPRGGAQ